MAEETKPKESETEASAAEKLSTRLAAVIDEISKLDIIRLNYRTLLDNKKLRAVHTDEMKKMAAAVNILKRIHDNPQEVHDNKTEVIEELKSEYGESHKFVTLATKTIDNLPDLRELPLIVKILVSIRLARDARDTEKKQNNIEKLRLGSEELKQFNDKPAEEAAFKALSLLEGSETEALKTFIEDTRHWNEWRRWSGGQPVDFFIGRIRQYLEGGEGFKGLDKDFKDKKIVEQFRKSAAVRNLTTFKKQIELFDNILDYLGNISEEKNWTADFRRLDGKVVKLPFIGKNGFFIKESEKYMDLIEKRFGNREFGRILREFKRKTGEQPARWKEEVGRLETRLKNPKFEEEHVIMPAARELEQIFMKRIESLRKETGKMIEEQRKELEKRRKELENAREVATKEFSDEIEQRKKQLERKWKITNILFRRREEKYLVHYAETLNSLEALHKKYPLRTKLIDYGTNLEIRKGELGYTLKEAERLGDDLTKGGPGRLYFLMDAVIHTKNKEDAFVDEAMKFDKEGSRELKMILNSAVKARKILRKIDAFIRKNASKLGLDISKLEKPIVEVAKPAVKPAAVEAEAA